MRDLTRCIKGTFVALLLGVALTACSIVYNVIKPYGTNNDNFTFICEEIAVELGHDWGVACAQSEKPTIVWSEALNEEFGTYGFVYLPDEGEMEQLEPYIYVNPNPGYNVDVDTIVQHEFAHYVLRVIGFDDGTWDSCQREEYARWLSQDGDKWDRSMALRYGCVYKGPAVD
jgi:hypothetical protein